MLTLRVISQELRLDRNRIGHAFYHGLPVAHDKHENLRKEKILTREEEEIEEGEEEEETEEEGNAGISEIMGARNLRTLHLQHNLLVHFGGVLGSGCANITRLTALTELRLDCNFLASLPPVLGDFMLYYMCTCMDSLSLWFLRTHACSLHFHMFAA